MTEKNLSYFFNNSTVGMALLDTGNPASYILVNDLLAETVNVSVEDHIGKTISEILSDKKAAKENNDLVQEVIRTGEAAVLESKGQRDNGKTVYYKTLFFPVYNSENNLTSVEAVVSDISAGREEQETVNTKQSKLIQAQYISRVGDFTWDIETGAVTWSEGMHKLLKYEMDEKINYGKVNKDIHHPDDLDRVIKWLNAGIASARKILPPNEYRLICKDGQVIDVHTEGRFEICKGKAVKLFGTCQDITGLKQIEKELRESERKYKTLINNIPGMVYKSHPDWSIEFENGLEQISGYKTDELAAEDKNWLNLIHPDDCDEVVGKSIELNRHQKEISQIYRIITKEGNIKWVEDNKTSIFSDNGEFLGVDGVLFDITKRKKAEIEKENGP